MVVGFKPTITLLTKALDQGISLNCKKVFEMINGIMKNTRFLCTFDLFKLLKLIDNSAKIFATNSSPFKHVESLVMIRSKKSMAQ